VINPFVEDADRPFISALFSYTAKLNDKLSAFNEEEEHHGTERREHEHEHGNGGDSMAALVRGVNSVSISGGGAAATTTTAASGGGENSSTTSRTNSNVFSFVNPIIF
jgi:hypothetical protein